MSKSGLLDLVAIRNNTPFGDVLLHYDLSPDRPGTKQVKINCPFHEDSTPSCSVNLERGIYKCFGCQASGNVLDFIAMMEEFTENHAYQAALVALDIIGASADDYQKPQDGPKSAQRPKKSPGAAKAQKTSQQASQDASEDVSKPIKENAPIDVTLILDHEHEFLVERGIDADTAQAFGIGHCRIGIMKNRIAIPIHNAAGELVAFAGRWADDDPPEKEPRYKFPKNFEKSLELFNLHRAVAMQKQYVVIVEGYWSVLRLHTAGAPTVSLMGSSVSPAQARLLANAGFKYAMLILDGDEAGRLATPSAVHVLSQELYVKTLVLPEGVKPDTMDASIVSRLSR